MHLPVKTAMEKKQTRERERYMRLIARVRVASRQKKFLQDPLLLIVMSTHGVYT